MFPVPYMEVKPPETRLRAWGRAINSLAQLIFIEALYAGIFAAGFNKTISSVTGEELFGGLFMAIMGIIATTFWPLMLWPSVEDDLLVAWNFKK